MPEEDGYSDLESEMEDEELSTEKKPKQDKGNINFAILLYIVLSFSLFMKKKISEVFINSVVNLIKKLF